MSNVAEIQRLLELNESILQQLSEIRQDVARRNSPWMDKDEAAAYIRMSKSSLDRYMDQIPHSKATGKPKFHVKDLDNFLKENTVEIY